MLQTDVCDHCNLRSVDCVCAVERTAHADLKHDNIAVLCSIILHRNRGHELKLTRMVLHSIGNASYPFRDRGEIRF